MKFCDKKIQNHLLSGGKIKTKSDNLPVFLNKYGSMRYKDMYYSINKNDLTADDWEILESDYDWNKIIKDKILCVFSLQKNFEFKTISMLSKKDEDNDGYFTSQGMWYKYCKPFNPADFNIAKDLKEYEK